MEKSLSSKRLAALLMGGVSLFALGVLPTTAPAQVIPDGALGTNVAMGGPGVAQVTGGTIAGNVQYHGFDSFNVASGTTVNVFQNTATNAMVNLIRGGQSTIDGQVNFTKGGVVADSNVFLLNSDGFIVGGTGSIHAGLLTIATPTALEMDALALQAAGTDNGAFERLSNGAMALADGNIEIYGQIHARRLTMSAGARMIVDGSLLVEDGGASGTIAPAVNTDGVPTAGGAQVLAGGVIRLHAGGTMRVGGQAKASRGTSGGLIEATADGPLALAPAGLFDVGGASASEAGSVVLYTKGSATLEPGLRVAARSGTGEGGRFILTAEGDIDLPAGAGFVDLDMGSDTAGNAGSAVLRAGKAGSVFVIGSPTVSGGDITVRGDIATRGGDIALQGLSSVLIDRATVSSRGVSDAETPFGVVPSAVAGNILIGAPEITLQDDARLWADGNGDARGGMVALVAEASAEETVWAVGLSSPEARITLSNASIVGGAVSVVALATAAVNYGEAGNEAAERLDAEQAAAQNSALSGDFEQFFTDAETYIETLIRREAIDLNNLLPFRAAVMSAEATITIDASTLVANSNWKGAGADPKATDDAEAFAANGVLSAAGLRRDTYELLARQVTGAEIETTLPTAFDAAQDAVFVHAHAQTDVTIKPEFTGLGVAVAITDTHARLRLTGSTLESSSGRVQVNASIHENLDVALAPGDKRDLAASVIVSVRNATSQVVTDGGLLRPGSANGALLMQALTGKTHSLSNSANAGKDGKAALAVTVSIGSTLTELAVNSAIQAGDVNLLAETLYFDKSTKVEATMGVTEPEAPTDDDSDDNDGAKEQSKGFVLRLKDKLTGKDADAGDGDAGDSKPGFAFALTTDVSLDNVVTLLSVGGGYTDLSVDARPFVAFTDDRVITAGDVVANARFRFATEDEGGQPLRRSIDAAFGALSDEADKQIAAINEAKEDGEEDKTKADFIGEFGNAVFLAASVASITGTTQAEIGARADMTVSSLDLSAATIYPQADVLGTIKDNFRTFIEETADFELLAEGATGDSPEDRPSVPSVTDIIGTALGVVDISEILTTEANVSALAPSSDDEPATEGETTTPAAEDQELAVGINVNYFNTTHVTRAAIRDGARITTTGGAVTVDAAHTALFLHATNYPKQGAEALDDDVNNAVGGSFNVVRTRATTEALIEDGANVTSAAALDVTARTAVIQGQLAYMGGSASEVAINAAVGVGIMESETLARLGAGVVLDVTGLLTIEATDDSINVGTAGAIAASENIGVGASGAINFAKRTVWAGIGGGPTDLAAAVPGTITAGALTITADNNAHDITIAVAGAKVAGSTFEDLPEPPAGDGGDDGDGDGGDGGETGAEPGDSGADDDDTIIPPWLFDDDSRDEDDDMIIPTWLFDDEETDAIDAQKQLDTDKLDENSADSSDSTGEKQTTGWGVAGAASVNLILGNVTTAEVSGASLVQITGATQATATNSGVGVTLTGAAAAGLSTDQDANALAGSFAIHVDNRRVRARVRDTTLTGTGTVTITADDKANVVNVAVGGAGTSRGDLALAGSVAVAVLTGGAKTDIDSAALTGSTVQLGVGDESLTVSIAGAMAINMDKSQGYGIGIGIGVNVITRDALLRVRGATDISAAALSLTATNTTSIYGFGISAGIGNTGIAGSVSVNTILGAGARVQVTGTSDRKVDLDVGSLEVTATETNRIWSLAGAITGGQKSAVGGAITANVIASGSEATLSHVTVRRDGADLGAVTLTSTADSAIGTLAVAGAVAANETAVGVGLSGNTITADATIALTDSTVTQAASLTATATGDREIVSLGGGVAGSGKNAGGFAATINLMPGNDTTVSLDRSAVTTRTGAITARAVSDGRIRSLAAALSASGDNAIGGAATANVTTANTQVTARGGALTAATGLTLEAKDKVRIDSLAGGVALSGTSGVGAAIAVNVIAHDTNVATDAQDLTAQNGTLRLAADNTARMESYAVGLAVSGDNALSGSIAIGDIGNKMRVSVTDTSLDAGTQGIEVEATKGSDIFILSGAVAGSGSNAVGVAISVAMIHDTLTADVITGRAITGSSLSVTATGNSQIDALGIAGAGSGTFALSGSIVAAVIGRPGELTPTPETPPGDEVVVGDDGDAAPADPVGDGQQQAVEARKAAFDRANTVFGLGADDALAPMLDAENITRARVRLTDAAVALPDTTIAASETSTIRALAGGVAVGGTTGIGLGLGVNLVFGTVEADLTLPGGMVAAGRVSVTANQGGSIQAAGISGGGGGTVGGAGSITVNVLDRDVRARVIGSASGAALATDGGEVEIKSTQDGSIETFAGALGVGGTGAGGGAVLVNIMNDRVSAELQDVAVTTALAAPAGRPLQGAGAFTLSAAQTMTQDSLAIAGSGGGTGAFGGSFAVSIASGTVEAGMRLASVAASSVTAEASAVTGLDGKAGALVGGGTAAVGLGIVTNVADLTVRTDLDGASVRADGNVTLSAVADTTLAGRAVAGAAAGTVGVTGSSIANSARNTVEVLVRDRLGTLPSDVIARGSVLLRARGATTVALDVGTDETPEKDEDGIPSINVAGGGVAGVAGSVSVNTLRNRVAVDLRDSATLVGLGHSAVDAGSRLGGLVRGVAIDASTDAGIGIVTAGGAVGGKAGVAAMLGFNILDDRADVRIGGDGTAALVNVRLPTPPTGSPPSGELGIIDPHDEQATVIGARVDARVEAYTLTIAVGGLAGVGAAGSTTLVTGTAEIDVNRSVIAARDRVAINAANATEVKSYVVGVGGGFVGVSASANVNILESGALVTLSGSRVWAGGSGLDGARVAIGTDVRNDVFTLVTGIAAGAVAAGGAVQVNSFASTSRVRLQDEAAGESTVVTSSGDVEMSATTGMETETYAASGAAGAVGIGLSANVNLARAITEVELVDGGQSIDAGNDLSLEATEAVKIEGLAGAVGLGATGAGASIDYARFSGTTRVVLGNGAGVTAGGAIVLDAQSTRELSSSVMVGGAGGLAQALAISVVELGQRAAATVETENGERDLGAERDGKLSDVQGVLADDQDSASAAEDEDGLKSATSGLASYAGGEDARRTVVTRRQGVTVDADLPDVVGVYLRDGVTISAGTELRAEALARSDLRQEGGGLAVGIAGIASGTVVGIVATQALIEMGDDVSISANDHVRLRARTEGIGEDGASLDANAATVAGGIGFGAAGVAVAVSRLDGTAAVRGGENLRISGRDAARVTSLQIEAERADIAVNDVFNLAGSVNYGTGVAVSDARGSGTAEVALGRDGGVQGRLDAGSFGVTVRDDSRVQALGEGSAGGIVAGVNGVIITAINAGSAIAALRNVTVDAQQMTVSNAATAGSRAEARGIAVGAVGIGASVAVSRSATTLSTTLSGVVTAQRVDIDTRMHAGGAGVQNSFARAVSTSGGTLALNGADARAYLAANLTTDISGTIAVTDAVSIRTRNDDPRALAEASGKQGGLAAVGLTMARAGQQSGQQNRVITRIASGQITAPTLTIASVNTQVAHATAEAGSGGLFAGSGSETRVNTNTVTRTEFGAAGALLLRANVMTLGARHRSTATSLVDTLSAAALGASGADSRTTGISLVEAIVHGPATIEARTLDLGTANDFSRPQDGFNVKSGSGGAIDSAAMLSAVTITPTTLLDIRDGATIRQIAATPETAGSFRIGTSTNIALTERQKLDAGGAVAIPVGNARIDVIGNSNRVQIGAARIIGVGTVEIFSGGDANLFVQVDAKSYGLAGAASSITTTNYAADNRVVLGTGADLTSDSDIVLKAGHLATRVQNVELRAESRVFNKTAFPISIIPSADALADTGNLVEIGAGASVRAVRDVYLFGESGNRSIVGYGRGKDLYLQVLEEIGQFFSDLVDGGDVSLDIETGTSTDRRDDGILVDGYVRAGSRNRQVMVLDENNALDNSIIGRDDALADGIFPHIDIQSDQPLGSLLLERRDVLQGWLDDSRLDNAAARTAWQEEINQINTRLAGIDPDATTDIIVLPDIRAAEGNIYLRGAFVQGQATGTLEAPGNAEILIQTYSGAFLTVNNATIPDIAGGRILFNDVPVDSTAQIAALSVPSPARLSGSFDFDTITGATTEPPTIEIATFINPLEMTRGGSITVDGNVSNIRGLVQIISNDGDLDLRGDVSGLVVDLRVPRGDFVLGFRPGIRNLPSVPELQYGDYFDAVQDQVRGRLLGPPVIAEYQAGPGDTVSASPFRQVPAFVLQPSDDSNIDPEVGRILAGRDVYITADILNINGLIQAGSGGFRVEIAAGIDARLAEIRASTTEQRVTLYDTSEPVTSRVIREPLITASNARIFYDVLKDQIEIEPLVVQGGNVEIVGNIVSTGGGRIQSLDGFGVVEVISAASTPILLNRIDLGPEEGLRGIVRITDTGRRVGGTDENPVFRISEIGRVDGMVVHLDNSLSFDVVERVLGDPDDPDAVRVQRIVPTTLVASSPGRSGSYAPVAGRDFMVVAAEEVVQQRTFTQVTQTRFFVADGSGPEVTALPPVVTSLTTTSPLVQAPAIVPSLPGAAYDYQVVGRTISSVPTVGVPTVTTNGVPGFWEDTTVRQTDVTTSLLQYEHRLRADYPVDIQFGGQDAGLLLVESQGDVIFGSTVLNRVGPSTVTSVAGSVFTGGSQAVLNVGTLTLSAEQGSIGGFDGTFRVDQAAGAVLSANARDAIAIRELSGDMILRRASATAVPGAGTSRVGTITLEAEGSILPAPPIFSPIDGLIFSFVQGGDIDLRALTGSIGTIDGAPIWVETRGKGRLTARATGDIHILNFAGDMRLDSVTSDLGSVRLDVPSGAILDRNDIETVDIRTATELEQLWIADLGLTPDESAGRVAEQLEALRQERTRAYAQYWRDRDAAGGAPIAFELPADTAAALLNGGWTQGQLDAYLAERNALYAEWNAQSARDPDFDAPFSAEDPEARAILNGVNWSIEELTRSIRDGLVRETADTRIRVEDPNVTAFGDITLIARDGVGELLAPYEIAGGSDLSAEDLRVLSSAQREDITLDLAGNRILIRQQEDLNFAFTDVNAAGEATGRLRVTTTTQDIFLGAETPATIASIDAPEAVDLRIDGAMRDDRDGSFAVHGRVVVLESGNDASIGTVTNPLTVQLRDGGRITARGGTGVFLSFPTGGAALNEVFAGSTATGPAPVSITASGPIIDFVGADLPRIVAGSITLNGTSIGTAGQTLGIRLSDPANGAVRITTTVGDAHLKSYDDLPLALGRIAGGGRIIGTAGFLLTGADTLQFGTDATLALTAPQGIDLIGATGRDIAGGTLTILSGGGVGMLADPLSTQLVGLSFTGDGAGPTPLVVTEADDLVIGTITQSNDPASVTDIVALGTLSVGTVTSLAEVRLEGATITDGRITAGRTLLIAGGVIGGTSRMDVTTGRFLAQTTNGSADILLRDRDVEVEAIDIGGTGALQLTLRNGDLTLLAGPGISTRGGALTLTAEALPEPANVTLLADAVSNGGDLQLLVAGNLTAGADIYSGGGALTLAAGGDADLTGVIDAEGGELALTVQGDLLRSGATRSGGGTLSIDVRGDAVSDGLVASGGGTLDYAVLGDLTQLGDVLSGGGALTVTAGGDAALTGSIDSDEGDLALTVLGDLLRSGATRSSGGALSIDVRGDAVSHGPVASGGGTLDYAVLGDLTQLGDVLSGGGALTVTAGGDALLDGNLLSGGGVLTLSALGSVEQVAGRRIASGSGTLSAFVGGDFHIARIESDNATDAALTLRVDGTLRLAAGQTGTVLAADAVGALTWLRLGASAFRGPLGLQTQTARLDMVTGDGPTHINEQTGLIIESAISRNGLIDVFASGETVVRTLISDSGAPIVVSALDDIRADAATLTGGDIRLFAFGGALTGETGDFFQGNSADGVTVFLLARDDLRYREMAGDLRLGFALAELGELEIDAPDGQMTLGILGAGGNLSLTGAGSVSANVIGRAEVDLADVAALELVRPEQYGRRIAASPGTARMTATGATGRLFVGLVTARDRVELLADRIDAVAADATPADGLRMVLAHPSEPLSSRVDVMVIDNGQTLFFEDPFADVRPRLAGRERAEGVLTIEYGRIGEGQVNHGGTRLEGEDVVIGGDTYFRQRGFSMFAHTEYRPLSTVDDVQVLAIPTGEVIFDMEREIAVNTERVLVLNRRLGGVELQGGQGYFFGVGVETEIRGNTFLRGSAPGGVLGTMVSDLPGDLEALEVDADGVVTLPLVACRCPDL